MGKGSKNFALGAVVAAATGYVAGILTAPKSGKETRKDIQNAAIKAKTEGEKRLKQLHSELNVKLDQAKSKVGQAAKSSRKDLDKAIAAAGIARDKAREVLSAVHEGGAEDKDLKKAIEESESALEHLKTYLTKDADEARSNK